MTDYSVHIFYSSDDEGFIALIEELEGCTAFGNTYQEALEEVLQVKEMWLEAAAKMGKTIPKPKKNMAAYIRK